MLQQKMFQRIVIRSSLVKQRARVTLVLVCGSIYQGAILAHVFEPVPFNEQATRPWPLSGHTGQITH